MLPSPAFADDLEARLLAARGNMSAWKPCRANDEMENAPTLPSIIAAYPGRTVAGHILPDMRRMPHGRSGPRWRRPSSLALTVTTFTVAANASPGSAFYGVRRWQEDARTNLTNSDAERTKLHLQYATEALDALDAAVAQHAFSAYSEALGRFTDEVRQAQDALGPVPAGADRDTISASLDALRARGRHDLRAALPSLGWPGRITTTQALGRLGESVVTVTKVAAARARSQTGYVWTVTITGSGFQNGAILLVRQRPAGQLTSVTPTQVVAQLGAGGDDSLPHDVGVGNPDATAASTAQVTSEHDDDDTPGAIGTPDDDHTSGGCSSEQEDHSASCTPTAMPHQ